MIRAAFLLICMTSPAAAPATWAGWRECDGLNDCTLRTSMACIHGDQSACKVATGWHREECAETPEHDDCAAFRDEAATD